MGETFILLSFIPFIKRVLGYNPSQFSLNLITKDFTNFTTYTGEYRW